MQPKKRIVTAWQWNYSGREPQVTMCKFTEDLQGEQVRCFMAVWRGYLQSDARTNYDEAYRQQSKIFQVV